jgi:2-dehydropantoate 2-reductase
MAVLGPVLVMGAGAVGCFVGGRLQQAGAEVHFVGHPRVLGTLRERGLTLTSIDGRRVELPASTLQLHDEPPSSAALVLLCVKSGATAAATEQLAQRLPAGTLVLSLQNGVSNAATASAIAPQLTVLSGMVPFNLAELAPGVYHRGTTGELAAQNHPGLTRWLPIFEAAGLPLTLHDDMRGVLWSKLLLNLNNPVNALSGLPLRAQLLDRDYRCVVAALQSEAMRALKRAGIRPAKIIALAPQRVPAVLRLPTWAFRMVASRMLKIDGKARSSMADDLERGRKTEVDALCGEVVRLAAQQGLPAPLNARMSLLVESQKVNPRPLSSKRLRQQVGLRR